MPKSIYFNVEDDVKSVIARLHHEAGNDFILVFPRRCYLFSDPVNLKLLKKQLDMMGKSAAIMTMDERGQAASREAGFELKEVPVRRPRAGMGDIGGPAKVAPTIKPKATEVSAKHEQVAQPAAAPVAVKKKPTTHAIPKVAVHDTIFSDIPHRSALSQEVVAARKQGARKRRTVLIGAVTLLVLAAFVAAVFVLPRAQIIVHAKGEPVARDLEIALATATKQPDVNTLSMPAYSVDQILDIQDKFQSSGKKEVGSKAQGKVRVYNLTGASINLKAGTTTLTAKGKNYVFTQDQNYIKPVSAKSVSSPDSGHVALVVAAEGGEASNIPANTRLEITNQVFGNKPQLLYAVADEAIGGGNSRFVSFIDQTDISKAQATLTKSAVDQLTTSLKAEGRYLAERAFESEVVAFTPDKPAGTESPTFSAQLKVRIKGVVFDPVVLTNLVRQRVEQVLPSGSSLEQPEKDVMTFRVRQLDTATGALRLIVHLESKMYKHVDTAALAKGLGGKSKAEVEQELQGNAAVDKVEILLWPAWQSSMPRVSSRISVEERQN